MEKKEEMKFGRAATSLPAELSCLQAGGGAEGEAALATLEKQLICPICLELFNKPVVILPCQHNLCRKCANELYQPSLFQARTTMQVSSGRFRCPSCRHEVVLDRHGVYGLQRNLLVENIIDVYKQEVINNSKVTSPLPPPPPAQVMCSDHEGEKVNIFCVTCQVPTCSLCKVFGAHQSCQVAPLTDICQQKKDELSEGVNSLVAINNKVKTLITELEESCRNIEENCKTQKQIVCDKFSHMFSILEEKQKVMTQQITSEQEEKTDHAQALVRRYGDSVEANNKLMERAASSMEEQDMAAFVQNSRELITKVISASGSSPAETLSPGYESLSHYRFNFSRQERALRSIDFLKVVEDVPDEQEVEQEPEEPKESSDLSVEPKNHQETTVQNLQSVSEPVQDELIPTLTPSSVEPASAPVPPAPGLESDSLEPAGLETEELDFNDGGSGLMKNKDEEEEEEEEEEGEGCVPPDPVKEGSVCEEEEGMSTQQCEALGDAGVWTTQSETEDKHNAQNEEEQEKQVMKEETDVTFYPGWYKTNSWRGVSPAPEPADIMTKVCDDGQATCSTRPAASTSEVTAQTRGAVQGEPEPQIQPQSLWSLETQNLTQDQSMSYPDRPPPGPEALSTEFLLLPPLPHESKTQTPSLLQSQLKHMPLTRQTAAEAGVMEEEDMQGWVGSFDLGDSLSDKNDRASSVPPDEAHSGVERCSSEMDKENFALSDKDAEEKRQHNEEDLELKCVSELKERELGQGEAETKNKELEEGSMPLNERKEKMEDVSDSSHAGHHGVERHMDQEFEYDGLEKKCEDLKSESKEKVTSSVSLQAVTLLFYLLAFLVILQRVWAYIGCFIVT